MRELTIEQKAAGWVAIPDDCMEMPEALRGISSNDFETLVRGGWVCEGPLVTSWSEDALTKCRIYAYRILKSPEKQATDEARERLLEQMRKPAIVGGQPDPNAAMLQRDQRPEKPSPSKPLIWPPSLRQGGQPDAHGRYPADGVLDVGENTLD